MTNVIQLCSNFHMIQLCSNFQVRQVCLVPNGENALAAYAGAPPYTLEREFFIDNLLVRIHLIIEMILVDQPCAIGV